MDTVLIKSVVPRIGRILRVYREKTGRNQGAIAEAAGISVSMLSQIERGVVAPSIETLIALCGALTIELSELFKKLESDKPVRIHHPGERLRNERSGVHYEQLMTGMFAGYPAELSLIEVQAGCGTAFCGAGHDGIEMGYVLDGEARLTMDAADYLIAAGDSVLFSSRLPHRLHNSANKLFRAVWSIAPPHLDYLDNSDSAGNAI